MRRFVKAFRYGQKGFTLIELLIVIAILGVIAGAVVANLSKITGAGYVETANGELDSVRIAVQTCWLDSDPHAYPSGYAGTTLLGVAGDELDPYLEGVTKCKYSVSSSDGTVTGTTPSTGDWGDSKVAWDSASAKWVKS